MHANTPDTWPIMVTVAGCRILRGHIRLESAAALHAYAEKIGATIIYDQDGRRGTLNRGGYIVARFAPCDPLGW